MAVANSVCALILISISLMNRSGLARHVVRQQVLAERVWRGEVGFVADCRLPSLLAKQRFLPETQTASLTPS